MEKVKRNVRMAVIAQRLTDTPNQIHTLNEFASLFGAAKSTISEDITLLAEAFGQYGGGAIETVPGAAGGVRYRSILSCAQTSRRWCACGKAFRTGSAIPLPPPWCTAICPFCIRLCGTC